MVQSATPCEFSGQVSRPANDNIGATAATSLWALADPILNCADLSGDRDRYEISVHRFPDEQRKFFAALCYMTIVEGQGHDAYFRSSYAFQYEDALDFFMEAEMPDVAELMEAAGQTAANGPLMAAGLGTVYNPEVLADFDNELACLNVVARAARYPRRHATAFADW